MLTKNGGMAGYMACNYCKISEKYSLGGSPEYNQKTASLMNLIINL